MKKIIIIISLFFNSIGFSQASSVQQLSSLCFDMGRLGSVLQVYRGLAISPTAPTTTGAQSAAQFLSSDLQRMCALVIAIAQAKDLESSLNALRVANSMGYHILEGSLAFYDDATSFVQFTQNFAK